MSQPKDFQPVFERLKTLLQPFETHLTATTNSPSEYILNTPYSEKYRKELFFAAVRMGKRYVSYHLFPLYVFPDLVEGLSAGLKKRMQGKTCFNFTRTDDELFRELAQLTETGFQRFRQGQLV